MAPVVVLVWLAMACRHPPPSPAPLAPVSPQTTAAAEAAAIVDESATATPQPPPAVAPTFPATVPPLEDRGVMPKVSTLVATTTLVVTATDVRPGTAGVVDIVVDNAGSEFSTTGTWFRGDGGKSHGGDCVWAPRGIQNIATFVDGLRRLPGLSTPRLRG